MKRMLRPDVQTALAGLVNAALALLVAVGVLDERLVPLILGVLAGAAGLLAAWYSPSVAWGAENDYPRWLKEPVNE